jgi:hypothetical protein
MSWQAAAVRMPSGSAPATAGHTAASMFVGGSRKRTLAGGEVCFCASFLAQTKKERGATSGLIQKAAVQINLM